MYLTVPERGKPLDRLLCLLDPDLGRREPLKTACQIERFDDTPLSPLYTIKMLQASVYKA